MTAPRLRVHSRCPEDQRRCKVRRARTRQWPQTDPPQRQPPCGSFLPQDVVEDCLIEEFFYGPDGELKCGEDDWDGLRALFRRTRVKEDQHDDCDAGGQRHIEEIRTLNVWCLQ